MAVYSNNPSCLISLFFTLFILSSHTHFSICNASESEVAMAVYSNNPSCLISLFFTFFILSSHTHFSICNASESEVEDETPFTYLEGTGKGPSKWGQINPLWQACEKGKLQSPIDFLDQRVQVVRDLGELKRDYNPAHATIKNQGHDVTVRWKEDAGKIIINGTHFKLLRCHWHSPSEHTFNGTRYNLELHVIHMSSNGTIAVIGITYKYGCPDPFLAKVMRLVSLVLLFLRFLGPHA
ncbi:hypothetical protein RHSIM_Rhsim03G0029200 [Rhododendron simsii]|uniref:Alpha-carbonic anhydrase domain-containing protein n=1 Tax=Rhododendron simsii TaxID=118357 RepID=A0A834H562_RHOSS|nr:hypothetical protein RHSIM_Rhsim03G0029200 [Rhododendron simsii]